MVNKAVVCYGGSVLDKDSSNDSPPPPSLFVGTLLLRIKDRRLSQTLQNTTKGQDKTEGVPPAQR